jgi:hypothetical protein
MATPELSDDETRTLVEHLRATIAADPYPHSPRIRTLRGILAKLAPVERPDPIPSPAKMMGEPSLALARRWRRR